MASIPEHIIDQIRASSNIVEVISRYVALKKRGRNYVGLCPFHQEKTPSFSVNPEKQIYHCFGCGAGGNVFRFLMTHEKMGFVDAVKQLSQETGIAIPQSAESQQRSSEREQLLQVNKMAESFYSASLKHAPGDINEYIKRRGLSEESINAFTVGYVADSWDGLLKYAQSKKISPKLLEKLGLILPSQKSGKLYDRFRNRIMFPVHDATGNVIAFGGRTLSADPKTPKYINSPESPVYYKSQVLYGLFQARQGIRDRGKILVVEGYVDVIQLHQQGITNAVATSGTALTPDHARAIRRYSEQVCLCYDADKAGLSAAARGGEILFQNGLDVQVLILPQGEDPDSFVQKNGRDAFINLLKDAEDYLSFRLSIVRETYDLSRASDRSQAVNLLLEILVPMGDPIRSSFYVEKIAADLKLPVPMLLSELQKKQKAFQQRKTYIPDAPPLFSEQEESANKKGKVSNVLPVFTGAWGGEKDVILLLIRYYDSIHNYVYTHIEEQDFQNEEFRQLFLRLKGLEGSDQDAILHLLLNELDNHELRSLFLRELEHANKEFKKPAVYLQGCIKQIKVARYKSVLEVAKRKIQQSNPSAPDYLNLLKEMQQAMTELKQWQDVEPVDQEEKD